MRLSAQRRFQRAGAGRRGLLPDHHARRRALLGRARLSQGGAAARQSEGGFQGARHPHCLRRPARHRRRVSGRQRQTQRPRQCRGDRRVGRVQFAATVAAFGGRTGVAPAIAGHPGDRRRAGRRRRSQRPYFRPHHFALQGSDHAQRCGAQLERQAHPRLALHPHPPRLSRHPGGVFRGFLARAAVVGNARIRNARFRCSPPAPSAANCRPTPA